MAMPKLAIAEAFATGAADRNPARYKPVAELETFPLGPPSPEIMSEGLGGHWSFFTKTIPWLTEADRRLVEVACLYRANFWKNARYRVHIIDEDTDTKLKAMIASGPNVNPDDSMLHMVDHRATTVELRIMEKLGGTPTSRPKVAPPGRDGSNPKGKGKRKDPWW